MLRMEQIRTYYKPKIQSQEWSSINKTNSHYFHITSLKVNANFKTLHKCFISLHNVLQKCLLCVLTKDQVSTPAFLSVLFF